jgi:anti-sigma regulatory factor (Ser/Thr protein kinase)
MFSMQTSFDPPVRFSGPAKAEHLPGLLEVLDRYCVANGVDSQSQHDLHLIAEEACVNIISYAYSAGVMGHLNLQVAGRFSAGRPFIEMTIEDDGMPFDPLALHVTARTAPVEEIAPGGLGVLLIRRLSDVQHYVHDPRRGNVLTIGKFITRADNH